MDSNTGLAAEQINGKVEHWSHVVARVYTALCALKQAPAKIKTGDHKVTYTFGNADVRKVRRKIVMYLERVSSETQVDDKGREFTVPRLLVRLEFIGGPIDYPPFVTALTMMKRDETPFQVLEAATKLDETARLPDLIAALDAAKTDQTTTTT